MLQFGVYFFVFLLAPQERSKSNLFDFWVGVWGR